MGDAPEWKIKILPAAQTELDEMPDSVRSEALQMIADLPDDPFPPDSIVLPGYSYRPRVKFYSNQFRLLYDVSEKQKTIYVFRVRHPRGAYRGL